MLRYVSARRKKLDQPLSDPLIRSICAGIFPKRNGYNDSGHDFAELVPELAQFGVCARGELKRLLTRHRRTLMLIDRAPFDAGETQIYSEMIGVDELREDKRRQFFYAFPAFVRNAVELEFGVSVLDEAIESLG